MAQEPPLALAAALECVFHDLAPVDEQVRFWRFVAARYGYPPVGFETHVVDVEHREDAVFAQHGAELFHFEPVAAEFAHHQPAVADEHHRVALDRPADAVEAHQVAQRDVGRRPYREGEYQIPYRGVGVVDYAADQRPEYERVYRIEGCELCHLGLPRYAQEKDHAQHSDQQFDGDG